MSKEKSLLLEAEEEIAKDNFENARLKVEEFLSENDANDSAWFLLGVIYTNLGIAEKALESFRKSADINPKESGKSWVKMGTIYVNLQMGKEAEICYKNATVKDPDYLEGWVHLGMFYYLVKKYKKMLEPLELANKADPENEIVISAYALANLQNKQYTEALSLYTKLHQKNSDDTSLLSTLGEIHYILGNYDQSINYIEQAIKLESNNVSFWRQLKRFYRKIGDRKKVKECKIQIKELTKE